MFGKKKEVVKEKVSELPDNTKLATDVLDLKLQGLMRKVAEQEILIRRLLELIIMNVEHRSYDKFLLPKITQIKNMLDKK